MYYLYSLNLQFSNKAISIKYYEKNSFDIKNINSFNKKQHNSFSTFNFAVKVYLSVLACFRYRE